MAGGVIAGRLVLDRVDEAQDAVSGRGVQCPGPVLGGDDPFRRLFGVTHITLFRPFVRDLTPLFLFVGKGDLPYFVIDPYPFKPLLLAEAQDRIGQIVPPIFQHALVGCLLDEIAHLDGVADDILPKEGGKEIDIDIGDDSERDNQQDNEQHEELNAERVGNTDNLIKYPWIPHGFFYHPRQGYCNRILDGDDDDGSAIHTSAYLVLPFWLLLCTMPFPSRYLTCAMVSPKANHFCGGGNSSHVRAVISH